MRAFTKQYCFPFRNARAKSEGGRFRRLQKAPKTTWLPYHHHHHHHEVYFRQNVHRKTIQSRDKKHKHTTHTHTH